MTNLNGKTAIVTGSSRGIGQAIATRLAQENANVVVTYHSNQEQAEEVVTIIKKKGVDAIALQVNVREIEDVRDLFNKTINHFGKVDILVNNAAGKNIFKPTAQMTLKEYDSMFDITRGVYFALAEAAKRLADGGRIISISTGGTSMAIPAGGAYVWRKN
jgi:3-oxoacyl-[acyl-carrier protein] reductase